jgi:peptidoglycan/xylan/chitin deacetylase (PgdA/CDA1 family)
MSMTPFKVWVRLSALTCVAFFLFPEFRVAIGVITGVLLMVFAWGVVRIRSNFFCKVYCSKPVENKKLCLTFDDGPDPGLTNDILDMLCRYNFTATFFAIGNKAANHPEIVKKAFDLGHTIACHDLTHSTVSNFRMSKALLRDISASQRIIEGIINKKPMLYRPPVGLMNPHIPGVLRQLDMRCIGWNKSVGDAGNRRQEKFSKLPKLAQPGNIILLHDCLPNPELKKEFLENLENLFRAIKEKGLQPVSIGKLLNVSEYQT